MSLSTHFATHIPPIMYVIIVGAYTIAATEAAIPAPKTRYTVDTWCHNASVREERDLLDE